MVEAYGFILKRQILNKVIIMPLDRRAKASRILWSQLRLGRFYKIRFTKEATIGPYTVDFYAAVLRLVVEIVPDIDQPMNDYDHKRLFYFTQGRITVFKVKESDLFGRLEAVLDELKACVRSLALGARL